jgi:hypothetical protein
MHGWENSKDRSFNSHYQNRSDEKSHYLQKQIIQILYRPSKIVFQNQESYELDGFDISEKSLLNLYPKVSSEYLYGIDKWKKHLISSNFSMWDSINRTYSLYSDFSIANKIHYDLIVRMRYDVMPHIKLKDLISQYETNTILVPANNMPEKMVCDWFALGEASVMTKYFDLFLDLPDLMFLTQTKYGQWCNELGLYEHLIKNKVKVVETEMKMAFC